MSGFSRRLGAALRGQRIRICCGVVLTTVGMLAASAGAGARVGAGVPPQVPPDAAYTPVGTIVADNGFRPKADGFSFPNYGSESPYANLSTAEMRDLFGDAACATKPSDTCALAPTAQLWLEAVNTSMGGGHCFGFSVTSLELFKKVLSPKSFGASRTPSIRIEGNEAIQHEIAYAWATQMLPAMKASMIAGTPNEQLERLRSLLTPDATETYTIAIFNQFSGHAVTPYAIEDRGDGTFGVLIYDNNFPLVTRAITIDTINDTWVYDLSAGTDPAGVWGGDANIQTLFLEPTSPGRGRQPCPFCGGAPYEPPRPLIPGPDLASFKDVFLQGGDASHGHLLITDAEGRRFGYVGTDFVEEIPGVTAIAPILDGAVWKQRPEPIYRIPAALDVTLTVDGSTLTQPDTTDLMLVGPGYNAAVRDIELQPGQTDELSIDVDGTALRYTTTSAQTPRFVLGTNQLGKSYEFAVSKHDVPEGGTFAMSFEPESGKLDVTPAAGDGGAYDLTIRRLSDLGVQTYTHRSIDLNENATSSVAYGTWRVARRPITVKSVSPSGEASTQRLANEAVRPHRH